MGLTTMFKSDVAHLAEGLLQSAKDAGGSSEYRRGYRAALSHLLRAIGYELRADGKAVRKR